METFQKSLDSTDAGLYSPFNPRILLLVWGFPKIRGTILGVLTIRIIVYWGLYLGPLV